MTGKVEQRLTKLGVTLPVAPKPAANYVPFIIKDELVFVSGQLPLPSGGKCICGKMGAGASLEQGREAARLCAINLVSQIFAACAGNLDRVTGCIRLGGYVNATPDFGDHPLVINGASDLIVSIFGDLGRHSRSAIGVPSLPFGALVEIDAVFAIRH